jgi:hypothetical protein
MHSDNDGGDDKLDNDSDSRRQEEDLTQAELLELVVACLLMHKRVYG